MSPQLESSSGVLFEKRGCIGLVTLSRPRAINSLNLEMCQTMADTFLKWKTDPEIACVFIQGAGEKGFCAGGDVKLVREAIEKSKTNSKDFQYVLDFFCQEYRNDYQLSIIDKPIITWASGITMGGGLGVMQGTSYRVVTETTMIAMPEISIGLYPDVGAAYFLAKLPPGVGLFLGLTAARFGPHDAIELELADFYIKSAEKEKVLQALQSANWSDEIGANHTLVAECLLKHKFAMRLRSTVSSHIQDFAKLDHAINVTEAVAILEELAKKSPWVAESFENTKKGSPLSLAITFEYLKRAKEMSKKQVFIQDFKLSINHSLRVDFSEGVRAVLVDKGTKAQWQFPRLQDVSMDEVLLHFTDPWEQNNKDGRLLSHHNPFLSIMDSLS